MKRCLISEKPWSFAKKLGAVTISIDRQFWTHFPAIFFSYRYYYILHLYNSTGFFPSSFFFPSFAFVVRCIWQKPPSMPMPWRGSIPLSFSTFSRFYRNNLTPYKISLLLLLLLCPRPITESEQDFFSDVKKKAIHANYYNNRKKKKGTVRNGSGVTTCRALHNRRLIWSQSILREREKKLHERLSPGRGPIMPF